VVDRSASCLTQRLPNKEEREPDKESIISFVDNRFRDKIDARRHTENVVAADMEVESGDSLSMDLLSAGSIQLVSSIRQLRIRECKFEEASGSCAKGSADGSVSEGL
jgi:hypothetical protein